MARLLERSSRQLVAARVHSDPRLFLAATLAAPPALLLVGWIYSPALGICGLIVGLALPRLYLRWLIRTQASRSEAEAPRLLQALLAGLSARGTYLDALREARMRCVDPWLIEDLDLIVQRFLLNTALHESLREVRARTTSRNLGLVWETLRICTENHLPTEKARALLFQINSSVLFNVQLRNEVRARAAGQQAQIWLLAVIVPGMFLYLHLVSPELLSVLDQTVVGRYVLLPLAAILEVAGILLSFRIARVDA